MALGRRGVGVLGGVGVLMVVAGLHYSSEMKPSNSEGPQRMSLGPKGVQYPYDQINPGQRSVLNAAAAGRPEDTVGQLAGDQDSDPGDPDVIRVRQIYT